MSTAGTATSSNALVERTRQILNEEDDLRAGGGPAGHERQKKLGRLSVRTRIEKLLDDPKDFLELSLWAAWRMYPQWGDVPAAGVVTGVGTVSEQSCMIVANDATVKAGAFFPQTAKKIIRAQRIAFENNLPLIYLVDSAGVFLPLQDEVFPDEDDFGRIFRNNAVLSAAGVPQYAAIMGNCVAGGAYLPVLCDKVLMTEGSGLYLAGPSLVKAAIGQTVEAEELGGAHMHSEVSGTVDFYEPNDEAALAQLRKLVVLLPNSNDEKPSKKKSKSTEPERPPHDVYDIVSIDGRKEYDARDLLKCIVDAGSMSEYKADYGQTLACVYAKVGGTPVGIVANQRTRQKSKKLGIQIGGVIYTDSADKAARFIMDCNQSRLPIVFIQDVQGFMVGRDAEQAGIIRSGAKMVNAMSNCTVPKITVIVGGSFGAGNYALCGRAFDPRFIFAWPSAKFAVMGAEQASETLFSILKRARENKKSQDNGTEDLETLRKQVRQSYQEQLDIRYAAARGWVDGIIAPETTRDVLVKCLKLVSRPTPAGKFHTGVLQV
jgi:acetyl-CoA carboxylase carboxyltransferase component